ncbi:MAG: pyroglutamyl-peptidase I family protein [Pirellulales bacterium]
MKKILITAFEPYGNWDTNVSQLIVQQLEEQGSDLPPFQAIVLPVDYDECYQQLTELLTEPWEFVLHLGQSPGSTAIALEQFAINHKSVEVQPAALDDSGPAAFRSRLPLEQWSTKIQKNNIPCGVSCHAGTYLCNAVYYWSSQAGMQTGNPMNSLFVHVPFATEQIISFPGKTPASLSLNMLTDAVAVLLKEISQLESDELTLL